MKKLILILAFVSSMLTYAQDEVYFGLYNTESNFTSFPRPYVYARFNTTQSTLLTFYSVIGAGWNYDSNLNFTVGGDLVFGYSNIRPIIGAGIRFSGYSNYYHEYLPDMRAGFEIGRWKIIASHNWDFTRKLIDPPFGYSGGSVARENYSKIESFTPKLKPTVGVFYSF